MTPRHAAAASLCAIASCLATPAWAQDDQADEEAAPAASTQSAADGIRVFEPAYFAQYAPRNALEMVQRLPGFSISGGNDQGQRGLGQADQNVIVNGQRFSSKSESLRDQLGRIPAGDVVRIELVDGNTLDIPGLTGLVANVIYNNSGAAGQFRWNGEFRAHNTEAKLFGGEVSLTGSDGALDFTVSLSNDAGRFGADGPAIITAPDGSLIEEQYSVFSGGEDNPRLATRFTYDFGGSTIANLNLSYGENFFFLSEPEVAYRVDGPVRSRTVDVRDRGPKYEIGADIEFPLVGGKLKLIGLERFQRSNQVNTLVDTLDDGSAPTGFRFAPVNASGERIGRGEFGWRMWDADWQVSGEAAFNRLDRVTELFDLDPAGNFVAIPLPGGTGGVREDRYETSLSVSKELSSTLSTQVIGTMEFSKLEQTGDATNSRRFKRPKGSVATTWKPRDDLDVSLTFARRVSQLSFGDFLASISVGDENENGGNSNLVPYQSWNVELEANKRLGKWGSIKLDVRQAWFEDFIDWFPLPGEGEARGNIGDAERLHLQVNATINLDPIGIPGARFDLVAVERWMSVTDPFTGEKRPFSYDQEGVIEIDFRHDIPRSDWAWGGSLYSEDRAPYSRRYEFGRDWEGPVFSNIFVENKDVFGLTVQAQVGNILGARNKFERTVYAGPRPDGEVLFREERDRRIGPIFRLSVSGDF